MCQRQLSARRPPRLKEAHALFVGLLLGEIRENASFEHDEHPIGEGEDLAQLRRDEEHRPAVVALDDEPLMYVFGRADVEAARRLLGMRIA